MNTGGTTSVGDSEGNLAGEAFRTSRNTVVHENIAEQCKWVSSIVDMRNYGSTPECELDEFLLDGFCSHPNIVSSNFITTGATLKKGQGYRCIYDSIADANSNRISYALCCSPSTTNYQVS